MHAHSGPILGGLHANIKQFAGLILSDFRIDVGNDLVGQQTIGRRFQSSRVYEPQMRFVYDVFFKYTICDLLF